MDSKYASEKSQDEGKVGQIVAIVTMHRVSCFFLFWYNTRLQAKVSGACLLAK